VCDMIVLNVSLHHVAAVKQILNPTVKLFLGDLDRPREVHKLATHLVIFALLATRLAAEIDGIDDAGLV